MPRKGIKKRSDPENDWHSLDTREPESSSKVAIIMISGGKWGQKLELVSYFANPTMLSQ